MVPMATRTRKTADSNKAANPNDKKPKDKQTSGDIADQEARGRATQRSETNAKAAKARDEGGQTPVVPVGAPARSTYEQEYRQDIVAFVGHQYRDHEDVDNDPNYSFDSEQIDKAETVDHIAVAGNASGGWLEIDGKTYFLDVELGLALYRLWNAVSTTFNN